METYCNDCPRRCGVVRAAFGMKKDARLLPQSAPARRSPGGPAPVGRTLYQRQPRLWRRLFTGCNLRCCFCQNATISMGGTGVPITVDKLRELYGRLIAQGAHNINLVTPTPYKQAILASLAAPCRYRSSTTAAAMNRRRRLTISRAKCRSICPI